MLKRRVMGIVNLAVVALFISFSVLAPTVLADTNEYDALQTPFYDPNSTSVGRCVVASPSAAPSDSTSASGLDYAGRQVLGQDTIAQITANQPFYQQASDQVGIPWQMIAVIHLRESGLKRTNPTNGQGVYQFSDGHGGPYPTGPVSDDEFQRQTILAAQFIKAASSANYTNHRLLTVTSDAETIKDTFFSYNGRASVYAQQAQSLGFSSTTQGYEGSPYVMNKADAQRDPDRNPTGWGQIKTDHGGIEYPANSDYGAFVEYAALTGIPISNCISGNARQLIVKIAEQELAKWGSGQIKAGTNYYNPTNHPEDWCADFVSWVYAQAGAPLSNSASGNIAAVLAVQAVGQKGGQFNYNDSANYTPQPGDIAIHLKPGDTSFGHVNIVESVTGNAIQLIGGNQGGSAFGSGYDTSSVSSYSTTGATSDNIVGYVGPN